MKTRMLGCRGVVILLATSSPASAAGRLDATLNEASIATKLSQQVGLLQYCGLADGLDGIPAKLNELERTHFSRGRPLSSDMELAVTLNTATFVSKAGGKQKLCGVVQKAQAVAVSGVQQGWKNLQKAHAAAKTAGH